MRDVCYVARRLLSTLQTPCLHNAMSVACQPSDAASRSLQSLPLMTVVAVVVAAAVAVAKAAAAVAAVAAAAAVVVVVVVVVVIAIAGYTHAPDARLPQT